MAVEKVTVAKVSMYVAAKLVCNRSYNCSVVGVLVNNSGSRAMWGAEAERPGLIDLVSEGGRGKA